MTCENVLKYFYEISKIPRPSYFEKDIADYLCKKGHEFGLEVFRDNENNVILKKNVLEKPTGGLILQAHTDMVWMTDFEDDLEIKIPQDISIENGIMTANKTTLGADNGIGIALILALLEDNLDNEIVLECLFTSNEEETMGGALALKEEHLYGQYLINLDSEQEGVITIGAAGGITSVCTLPIKKKTANFHHGVSMKITGGKGGHSGLEIHKKRENAIKLLVRLLNYLQTTDFELTKIEGGNRSNAIPSQAIAYINTDKPQEIREAVKSFIANCQNEWQDEEDTLECYVENTLPSDEAYYEQDKQRVLLLLENLPHGVKSQTEKFVCSSVNLATLQETEQGVRVELTLRSSYSSWYYDEVKRIARLVEFFGGITEQKDEYAAWQYQKDSYLLYVTKNIYKELFNKEVLHENVHAGVECGIIMKQCPSIKEAISLGPTLRNVHTTKEELDVTSVSNVYKLLREVIIKLNSSTE